jgi:hypothetical protein
MSLVSVLISLSIVGVVLWLINTYMPMDGKIKNILNVVVVIMVILWLASGFGLFGSLSNMHMESFHIR